MRAPLANMRERTTSPINTPYSGETATFQPARVLVDLPEQGELDRVGLARIARAARRGQTLEGLPRLARSRKEARGFVDRISLHDHGL